MVFTTFLLRFDLLYAKVKLVMNMKIKILSCRIFEPYLQKILNTLFSMTPAAGKVTKGMVVESVEKNVNSYDYSFSETLFRLPGPGSVRS